MTDTTSSRPVGVAEPLPGTAGGFTMAVFEGSKVPSGTALYARPKCAPSVESLIQALTRIVLTERDRQSSDTEKIHEAGKIARAALKEFWE